MSSPKPKISREEVKKYIADAGIDLSQYKAGIIVAIRGYYMDTKGDKGENDVGIYDDVLIWYGHDRFDPILGNTDPSKVGWNPGVGKPYAMLVPGIHYFIRGSHKNQAKALRQPHQEAAHGFRIPNSGHFEVYRARSEDQLKQHLAPKESGYFAINIHAGGEREDRTSSWGCLTYKPSDGEDWMDMIWKETRKAPQDVIPLLLVDNTPATNRPAHDEEKKVPPPIFKKPVDKIIPPEKPEGPKTIPQHLPTKDVNPNAPHVIKEDPEAGNNVTANQVTDKPKTSVSVQPPPNQR